MLEFKEMWKIMSELWEWCAENPDKSKSEWPGWIKYGNMDSYCPLCKYVAKTLKKTCSGRDARFCPAMELWPYGCLNTGSIYYIWLHTPDDDSKSSKAAKEIAEFAKRKYQEVSE